MILDEHRRALLLLAQGPVAGRVGEEYVCFGPRDPKLNHAIHALISLGLARLVVGDDDSVHAEITFYGRRAIR